ncbi:MurR/RpiR family transcriptional regulator [Deinococcus sp. QL22]|uniref:MurR/RpiR family transcriptional regulator n=1 Tax=Deinococcus sp. QL22 TaxID=2939437 RepID=UPI002017CEA0|nr:MurR/RpiR family transcriptional regulator [Deinococcus sp. QL22]UQN09106.1 MurR/RpiR family transcriptional regulator [Deinococcus sp. QL22]
MSVPPAHLAPMLRRLHLLRGEVGSASIRVIDHILSDPEGFLPLTIAELSDAAQTSDATVVRLVQALGFGGYQEFKLQLSRALAVSRHHDLAVDIQDTSVTVLRKVFDAASTALSDTLEHLNLEHFSGAVQAMSMARHIELIGLGGSGIVARDGQQRALRLGLSCGAQSDPGTFLPFCSLMEPTDVLIAICFSGTTPDILRAARLARQAGVTVVALTGLGRTPLVKLSHFVLTASAPGDEYRPENVAVRLPQLALLDALLTSLHVSQEPYMTARLTRVQNERRALHTELPL